MFYAALVRDVNPMAESRVQNAYVDPVPTVFFDGGFTAVMGGGENMIPSYDTAITEAAQRPVPPIDLVTAIDWLGNNQVRVHVAVGNGTAANTAPNIPSSPIGFSRTTTYVELPFETSATDPEQNLLWYQWDWGDGEISDWLGPYTSGDLTANFHMWSQVGLYEIRVRVKDPFGEETSWSEPANLRVDCCQDQVGDANNDGNPVPTIGDVSRLIDLLFITGGDLACYGEGDVNQSGGAQPDRQDITIGDVSKLIDYLFITGPSIGMPDCL